MATYYTTTTGGYFNYTVNVSYNTTSTWNNWKWEDPDKNKENGDLLHRLNQHDPFETDYEINQRTRYRPQLWA